jgi:hypothetical protein
MASFNNSSPQEAIEAIGAGLRGEAEPLRRFGVLLDDATLKARALEEGIWDGEGALTGQERALAASAEIMAQTTDQQGDFARTSGGLANQTKILQAQFANLQNEIGANDSMRQDGTRQDAWTFRGTAGDSVSVVATSAAASAPAAPSARPGHKAAGPARRRWSSNAPATAYA